MEARDILNRRQKLLCWVEGNVRLLTAENEREGLPEVEMHPRTAASRCLHVIERNRPCEKRTGTDPQET